MKRSAPLSARSIAMFGLLTAIALVLGYIESFIPITQGIPGVKLGLSNTVLLYALYVSGSAAGAWLLMV